MPEFGGDHDRMFLTGGSAGGHLVSLLTLDERYLKKHGLSDKNIRAALPISGLMDVTHAGPSRIGVVWDDTPQVLKEASPLTYVRSDAPPILIMFADGETKDRARQNHQMYEALKQAGLNALDIKVLKDRTHNNIRSNLSKAGDPGLLEMLAFMKKYGANNVPAR